MNFDEIIKSLKSIRLTDDEKLRIRRNLLASMENSAVRQDGKARHIERLGAFLTLIFRRKYMFAALFLVIAVALSGGVSYAAQNSLPGDALYGVKIQVNEKVRTAFAFSDEAKAKVETSLATERLEEAEELAVEGRLDSETSARIAENFAAHAERVQARIADFESRGNLETAADLGSNFEVSLRAHAKILVNLGETSDDASESEPLLEEVQDRQEEVIKTNTSIEIKVSGEEKTRVKSAAEGKMGAAENKIAEVKAYLEKIEAKFGAAAVAEAKAQLSAAESLFAEGKTQLEADAYADSFVTFQKAHRTAQEAKLLVEARVNLDQIIEREDDDDTATSTAREHRSNGVEIESRGGLKVLP